MCMLWPWVFVHWIPCYCVATWTHGLLSQINWDSDRAVLIGHWNRVMGGLSSKIETPNSKSDITSTSDVEGYGLLMRQTNCILLCLLLQG